MAPSYDHPSDHTGDMDEHRWAPISVEDAAARFEGHHVDWWVAGGVAIDRFLGWVTRPHEDLDIEMFRDDCERLFDVFEGWELATVSEGRLSPWAPRQQIADHVFGIWGRPANQDAWAIEVILANGDGATWRFRRDPSITLPRSDLTATSPDGVRYCVPEVQLLYKAKQRRAKDDADFARCLPWMTARQRAWLVTALERMHPDHPWIVALQMASRLQADTG